MDKNFKGLLFDLDGVLVDTAKYHFVAWKKLAASLGITIDEAFNETLKGISRIDSLKRILEFGGIEKSEEEMSRLATLKNDWYVAYIQDMTPDEVLPGVVEFLEEAKREGMLLGVGSASKNAIPILEKIGLMSYFQVVIDGNVVTKSKPDPEVFMKGADQLGLPYEACVVFEDAFSGVQAAKTAGMAAVGIGLPEHLPNADVVVKSLEGVPLQKLLKKLI